MDKFLEDISWVKEGMKILCVDTIMPYAYKVGEIYNVEDVYNTLCVQSKGDPNTYYNGYGAKWAPADSFDEKFMEELL